jgi:hypothetical protein
MKRGENESQTEQKWKQQVMDQLLQSPTSRFHKSFLIASRKLDINIVLSFYESVIPNHVAASSHFALFIDKSINFAKANSTSKLSLSLSDLQVR